MKPASVSGALKESIVLIKKERSGQYSFTQIVLSRCVCGLRSLKSGPG